MKRATRGIRKRWVGKVVGNSMHKTVVVRVTRRAAHPLYRKIVTHHKKYLAHDELNACKVGDRVEIVECRPLSRRKSFRVRSILGRAE